MKKVACVLKTGGIYDSSWVEDLLYGLKIHASEPFELVCLTDDKGVSNIQDVKVIPLETEWTGWWAKIELFRPGLFNEPFLYVDLDTVVLGDFCDMFRTEFGITMVADFLFGDHHNSSCMSVNGDFSVVWKTLMSGHMAPETVFDHYTPTEDGRIGDQAFTEDVLRDSGFTIDTFPADQVLSYKFDVASNGTREGTRFVTFHGRPKQREVGQFWMR